MQLKRQLHHGWLASSGSRQQKVHLEGVFVNALHYFTELIHWSEDETLTSDFTVMSIHVCLLCRSWRRSCSLNWVIMSQSRSQTASWRPRLYRRDTVEYSRCVVRASAAPLQSGSQDPGRAGVLHCCTARKTRLLRDLWIWTLPVQHLQSVSGYFMSVRSQCSSSGPWLLRGFVTTAGTHPADWGLRREA